MKYLVLLLFVLPVGAQSVNWNTWVWNAPEPPLPDTWTWFYGWDSTSNIPPTELWFSQTKIAPRIVDLNAIPAHRTGLVIPPSMPPMPVAITKHVVRIGTNEVELQIKIKRPIQKREVITVIIE